MKTKTTDNTNYRNLSDGEVIGLIKEVFELEEKKEKETIKIIKRPYKNQREKDLELCKAYQKGILDERKEWKEKEGKIWKKIS